MTEIRVPRSSFRVDVAACAVSPGGAGADQAVIFECKQARSDLLRDTAEEAAASHRLRKVRDRRLRLERLLGLHLPNLRKGESLFAEYDRYDLDAIQHHGWRRVRREEAQLQAKLFARTKFDRLWRYGCADLFYLVVAPDVLRPHEAPAGWGVLEAGGDGLRTLRRPENRAIAPEARAALFNAIALAATRLVNREFGITREEIAVCRAREMPR